MKKLHLLPICLVICCCAKAQIYSAVFGGGGVATNVNQVSNPAAAAMHSTVTLSSLTSVASDYGFNCTGWVQNNAYMQVTLGIGTGYAASISSVNFDLKSSQGGPQAVTIAAYQGSQLLGTISSQPLRMPKTNTNISFPLSTPVGLKPSTELSFRIYAATASSSGATLRLVDFTVNGSVSGGAGGQNFANADLTANGDRLHDFGGHNLVIHNIKSFDVNNGVDVNNLGRDFYINRKIDYLHTGSEDASILTPSPGTDYILLHEAYVGGVPMNGDHFVMGKLSAIRGSSGAGNKKMSIEVNTSSANITNKANMLSYNSESGCELVKINYRTNINDPTTARTYIALKLPLNSSMSDFSFTGYARNEALKLVWHSDIEANSETPIPDGELDDNTFMGDVGIGTTDPTARLEVNSGASGGSGLKFTGLKATTAGTQALLAVDDQGNVVKSTANTQNTGCSALGNSDGTAGWYKLGTLTLPQGGMDAVLHIVGGNNYTADANSNAETFIHFRTSNGFAGSTAAYAAGTFYNQGYTRLIDGVKIIMTDNVNHSTWDVYALLPAYTGEGAFVELSSAYGAWASSFSPNSGKPSTGTDLQEGFNMLSKVVIGTNINATSMSDAYKLYVEGGIRTKKVKVDVGPWADYVFDKSYTLPTLQSVATYIAKNKHLPDMPSAATVAKEGVDLGDNQVVLLKKIEELTLYVIELQKQVDELKKKK
ncbi:hypothetical protein [Parasediminibacterium sp. JCM 36343]|uniref:hypothetical protein n=1 Tax=Parasediminibacterium sp. JCM 36343 TaxID=3374279 RepID=UPI00397C3725